VVKGPAASTLYGADASAGVIQVLTKKGRAGARRFHQTLTMEYYNVDPSFTPYANYARCRAADTIPTSPNPLCRGERVGTLVSDNVLVRNAVFNDGWAGALFYSAEGGGEGYGFYASFSGHDEEGTTLGSELDHRSGRLNFSWLPSARVAMDVSVGLVRAADRLPQGDQSSFGYLVGGDFGSPRTVTTGPDGRLAGGWFNNNLSVEAISAIKTEDVTWRSTPSVQLRYSPAAWFSNRLTMGADLVRTTASQMYPKNTRNWYGALSTGAVAVTETNSTTYTVDYLGNVHRRFGPEGGISADLSVGSQWIHAVNTSLGANGQLLLTNSNSVISGATTTTGSESYAESKSFGLFGQAQLGFRDRLYWQLGARVDRNSAFGAQVGSFFLPKAGVSYVLSEAPFWEPVSSVVSTLRLRAAYGTTGRSPSGTAALQTYIRTNYITDAGIVQPGVSPGSPGNPDLKPERGTEFEAGFDAGFFGDRAGIELTYFAKVSKDLLFPLPLAPSEGYSVNPLVNIGEVSNKGLEIALRARPIDRGNVSWDAGLNVSTLANEIVNMGDITPFVSANNQCFKPGVQVAAWCVPRVLSVDTVAGRAVVSDTARVAGGQLPKYTMSFNTTLTLFRTVRLYAQLDGKFDYHVYNLTKDFRDRALANSAEANLPAGQGGYSAYERVRRLGPFFGQNSGTQIGTALVRDPYIVPGDFIRFRELSVTWSLPPSVTRRLRVAGASVSVGGKNLALWTRYDGWDPEVIGVLDPVTPFLADVFTLPQTRRLFTRLTVQL
jgi:TonB-dependent starch-binding outer membrane protein SusC